MTRHVVLVGAGHAHVGVLRAFGDRPEPGIRLTLITRTRDTPYSGMLPGMVAGIYGFDDAHIDVGPLCRFAGATLHLDEVVGIDPIDRRVLCRNLPPQPYDLLSIDIGSTPNVMDAPGASAHAIPVKPIDGFLARFEALRARVAGRAGPSGIAVVGAGAGGIELLLAVERRLRRDLVEAGRPDTDARFVLVTRTAEVLPTLPAKMRARFASLLAERGIDVVTGAAVSRVEPDALVLADGRRIPADEVLWTTQASAAPWLAGTGLALDDRGFIRVAATLESVSHPGVFAAGDVASFDGRDLPKSGVHAVRQGPSLARNLRLAVRGRPLVPHRPQGDALYLISTGEGHAIGTRNGLVFEGDWVWRLKDWIDRRFMRRFKDLPEMPAATARGGDIS